ncbi:hypothetical protein GRI62_11305 [Erythrobacter arachoides]|uniref:Uncharacterized protein n=1 Tax=Aurantiacibacter arachoides TaxID=1850444 RepID=A0A845A434_9SPHN|nr:hypothetical protein [Aurantiacibacter arachoides]MXO94182.1 hypothetical protein [Aurantiacibacter arachoides]GGD65460.1 hypothetical protein GCM10011411_27250 [Aurantiacibacter arachoides]
MTKTPFLILFALVVALFVFAIATGNQMAAGGGALLLLAAIGYGTWQSKRATPAETARGERGARELREELAEDEARRGTR